MSADDILYAIPLTSPLNTSPGKTKRYVCLRIIHVNILNEELHRLTTRTDLVDDDCEQGKQHNCIVTELAKSKS